MTTQNQPASAFGGKVEIIGPGAQAVAAHLEALQEAQHTPTPWRFDGVVMFTIKGNALFRLTPVSSEGRLSFEANAAHIVHCVNSHPALVAENKRLRDALESISCNAEHEARLHGVNGATAGLSRVASTARAALAKGGAMSAKKNYPHPCETLGVITEPGESHPFDGSEADWAAFRRLASSATRPSPKWRG